MPRLSDYRLLSFDVYGTLINWEAGILSALQPALSQTTVTYTPEQILTMYQALESEQQTITPEMPYSQLLATIYPLLAQNLNLPPATEADCRQFSNSIAHWPAFPDTVDALQRLSKHYKLVVLSNVDRHSFAKTNAGSLYNFPFDMIITAQDVGSYKPDKRNFEYMLDAVKREFGVEREEVLQTAQSQFHDHQPAKKVGVKTVWIVRPGAIMGNTNVGEEIYDWKFDTLGDMADAVEGENM